jgi:hypothetical protein
MPAHFVGVHDDPQSIGMSVAALGDAGHDVRAFFCSMAAIKCGTARFALQNGQGVVFSSMSAAFSPIMIDGALVLPDVSVGMIEASAIRRPAMPRTRS